MTLAGTRPPTVDEWEKYELHHRARLAIKPGLTGMWQVSGRSEITDFEEVVKLDTKYISEWSWNIAKSVFDALGAKTYVINAEPNGTNINNNAGSTHIEGLQALVKEKGLDIIFSKYATTGDGILTSLKMMEVMLAKKKTLSELAAPFKIYPQVLKNVRVTDKKAAQNDAAVQEAVAKVADALDDTGRILKWDAEAAEKAGFEHFMMKEIHEQPKAVQDTLNSVIKDGVIDLSAVEITEEEIQKFEQIYIVACGSAWHAGMLSVWKEV